MSHLAGLRGVAARVTAAMGETVEIVREEFSGLSAQDSFSLGGGTESVNQAGQFEALAVRGPTEMIEAKGGFVQAEPWTIARADCDFPPAEGDWLTPSTGANAGTRVLILKVAPKAAGSAYLVHTRTALGAGGMDSSGEDY